MLDPNKYSAVSARGTTGMLLGKHVVNVPILPKVRRVRRDKPYAYHTYGLLYSLKCRTTRIDRPQSNILRDISKHRACPRRGVVGMMNHAFVKGATRFYEPE